LKVQFFVICSYDEILKTLQDTQNRQNWDYHSTSVTTQMAKNLSVFTYKPSETSQFSEEVSQRFMRLDTKFYIIENTKSNEVGDACRVWVLEQV